MITWKMHVSTPDLFLSLLHHKPYCFEASTLQQLLAKPHNSSPLHWLSSYCDSVCDPAPGTSTSRACRPQSLQRAAGQRCSVFNDYWQWSWILNMEYKWMFNGVEFYWKKTNRPQSLQVAAGQRSSFSSIVASSSSVCGWEILEAGVSRFIFEIWAATTGLELSVGSIRSRGLPVGSVRRWQTLVLSSKTCWTYQWQ